MCGDVVVWCVGTWWCSVWGLGGVGTWWCGVWGHGGVVCGDVVV